MFSFDSDALEHIFEGLESGFRKTPEHILLFLVLLAGFVALLVIIYFTQRIWRGALEQKGAERFFLSLTEEKRLSLEEQRMLRQTARELSGWSGWREKLGRLVTDRNTFNAAADRRLKRRPRDEGAIAALRLKLGFSKFDGRTMIHSSAELDEGLTVHVRQNRQHSYVGTISAQSPDSVVLRIQGNGDGPAEGDRLQVYFLRQNGVFYFTTRVKQAYDNSLRLEHSEEIIRVQCRKFYGGRVSLPVSVKKIGSSRPTVHTYILELGGGGLTLFNRYKVLHPADELRLRFALPEGAGQRIEGRVRRIDRGGSLAHVEFTDIKEPVRDKILGFVLNRAMSSG
jgi:hypothetical protein